MADEWQRNTLAVVGTLVPGQITTGVWCPTCALPSGLECDVYVLTATGVIGSVGTYRTCNDCGRRIP